MFHVTWLSLCPLLCLARMCPDVHSSCCLQRSFPILSRSFTGLGTAQQPCMYGRPRVAPHRLHTNWVSPTLFCFWESVLHAVQPALAVQCCDRTPHAMRALAHRLPNGNHPFFQSVRRHIHPARNAMPKSYAALLACLTPSHGQVRASCSTVRPECKLAR